MATILVVDDRPSNRQFLTTLLGYGGHRMLEAGDGAQALETVRAEHPALVITDILMPNMDGYEFVQRVRADPELAATPVIFYTATYSSPQAEALARSCGVRKVLSKPSEPQAILAAVNQELGVADQGGAAPPAAVGVQPGAAVRPPDDSMSLFLKDLEEVKQSFEDLAARSTKPQARRDAVKDLSRKFAANIGSMQRLTTRLSALLEVGMELMSERDPQRLVELFFAAACDLVDSKYAAVGMLDEGEQAIDIAFAKGFDAAILRGEGSRTGLLGSLLAGQRVMRMRTDAGAPGAEGLPAGHPRVRNLLGIPVTSANRIHGWMYFADKRGDGEFNEEDTRLATAMTRKLALLYENAMLYDAIQRHAARLQIEMSERKRAEIKIRKMNRVYAVLSGINTLIVRVHDRDELFREACGIAVKDGQFRMAWIGVIDRDSNRVKPVAWDGEVRGFFDSAPLAVTHARSKGQGLAWRAIREKRPMISNDIQNDPHTSMKQQCRERGINSLAILPLVVGGEGIGVLALYAAETEFFDDEEMKLLNELAGDISFALEHIANTEKLDYLAYYDELTALANRKLFFERVEQKLLAAGGAARRAALFVLDIERFKTINDALGRQAGDELLKQIAGRMKQAGVDPTRLARVGSNHFATVMGDVDNEDQVARFTERKLEQCFGTPFRIAEQDIRASAKVGIAVFPNDGGDAETLFRNAEAAVKKAKAGGERYMFYTPQMSARVAENLTLENKLRQALKKDEFVLHYQPKVDLETRSLVGVEALIRWQSPESGLVPPGHFIPLLEETGLILQVGAWALKRAARDHRGWVEQGLKAPRVAVNVSPIQLRQRDFVATVEQAIMDGVAPTGIDLEITESLIMQDVEATIEKLKKARGLGVKIAIDDFGTGYSSLAYLARLPVDTLKIDRSFVIRMLDDPDTATLVQTMITLAHSLKLKVVAEGVDAEEQAKVLRLLRCDEMQGYLFSKPVPAADIVTMFLKA